ncbi:NUDIX hydrolase [Acidomonas methanolica]|uniref:Thiamin pyrophosphokinase n=1 Tax=Acidomonas methanolica NBRC 104435 TaxID=1231351 RepID=A0A023D4R0_ACIMT|nr:NUDIX domain-containing protein [Acidomonas methanolica]TCS31576.1 NUDIX domain-containing protein [Acidomonas methanolica]GAJ28791.1 thiamin pyrophosphokinase [Acidomonas methanolica NBRC 104435]GEK97995.1 DUF4743 domain-containing protein [Acidomonas methanolica NBRC 104435]
MPHSPSAAPFLAHIARCHNITLPGAYRPFFCGMTGIGWVHPGHFESLTAFGCARDTGFGVDRGADIHLLGEKMAEAGLYRSHAELFDVITPEGAVIGRIDRGALPILGLAAQGVHMNGLVRKPDGLHLWMGHRARNKRLDPGKLDHLVAGGVCAGLTPRDALAKEAAEEAAIPPALIAQARPVSHLRYTMERPEGLRRDLLHCFDLYLPEAFTPVPVDGEVERFELVPIATAFALVRDTERLKFNVNLVLIDLFLRLGMVPDEDASALRQALDAVS